VSNENKSIVGKGLSSEFKGREKKKNQSAVVFERRDELQLLTVSSEGPGEPGGKRKEVLSALLETCGEKPPVR